MQNIGIFVFQAAVLSEFLSTYLFQIWQFEAFQVKYLKNRTDACFINLKWFEVIFDEFNSIENDLSLHKQ